MTEAELNSLIEGFRENYQFLRALDNAYPNEKDEPESFVNNMIKSNGTRKEK